jgi:hypothetical protein
VRSEPAFLGVEVRAGEVVEAPELRIVGLW